MKKKLTLLLTLMLLVLCSACACKEHSYGPWETTVPATCTGAGEETRLCTKCDEGVEVRPVQAAGHSWKEADCLNPKTCTVCQTTEGAPLGHVWKLADCLTPKTCSACRITEGEALGHSWKEADCLNPKTCTACRLTEGSALGHSYGEWVITQPASCTAAGTRQQTCSHCGDALTEALPLTEHSWQEATCAAPKTCSLCQLTEGEALPHTFEHYTCTVCRAPAEDHPLLGRWTLFAIVEGDQMSSAATDLIYIDVTADSRFFFDAMDSTVEGSWYFWGLEQGMLAYVLQADVDGSILAAVIAEDLLVVTDQTGLQSLVLEKKPQ